MRKRLKKKREIKEEIRHARIMRSLEKMHAITQHALNIEVIANQKFATGGVIPKNENMLKFEDIRTIPFGMTPKQVIEKEDGFCIP